MRLSVDVLQKPIRKVFKGGDFNNFEDIKILGYNILNEIVIDRGPSPNPIKVEIYLNS